MKFIESLAAFQILHERCMRKELNHQGIFLISRIRIRKLFAILIGKEQQFDLVIKKEEGSKGVMIYSQTIRTSVSTEMQVTSSSPVYCLYKVD